MATRAPERDDPTHPSEIPTALIEPEEALFDDEHTVGDVTTAEGLDATPTGSTPGDERFDKFRRPTRSEIARAVDQVNTEAVDVEALAKARAEARAEETDDLS